MNRDLYSAVRHAGLAEINPLPRTVCDVLLREALGRTSGTALDLGCGKASALIPFAERGWAVRGIDRSPYMVEAARSAVRERGLSDHVEIVEGDAVPIIEAMVAASLDCVICMGSTHIFGGLEATTDVVRRLVRPGGWVLLGELYWKTPPSDEMLEALGMGAGDLSDLVSTFALPVTHRLEPLGCIAATDQESRQYEEVQSRAGLAWCKANPKHPDMADILSRTNDWRRIYERFADTWFGFAACIYRAL